MKPYYDDGKGIVIYHGKCQDILPELSKVDLTVTSPPYDNLRDYEGYDFDFEFIAKGLYNVTKECGVVVWVVGDATINGSETGTSFRQALYFKEIGFNLHDTMIYEKDNCPFPSNNRYYANFEYMFIFSKGSPNTFNLIVDRPNKSYGRKITGTNRQKDGSTKEIRNKGNLIKKYGVRFNCWLVSDGSRQKLHPAIFPEQLARDHIISWSNKGDTVLDPMCGSGTTLKMAKMLDRKAIGIETSEKYCEIAIQRLSKVNKSWKEFFDK